MAEENQEQEQVMPNIDIQQFSSVQTLNDGDYIVLSLESGTSAKIRTDLFKKILEVAVLPNIRDGIWYVGEKNLDVSAIGKTPELRRGSSSIEYKYTDEDSTLWRPLIDYSDIKLQYDALTNSQKNEIITGVSTQVYNDVIKPVNEAIATMQSTTEEEIKAMGKVSEQAIKSSQAADKAAQEANKYANRVKDVTLAQWEEIEENKSWEEGVEYNVYEV
jgi:hypothetical protein